MTGSEAVLAVAVAQFAPSAEPAANREQVTRLTRLAAERGARLVLFPEYSNYFIDPFDDSLAAHAETLEGPFATHLREVADEFGIVVVAGLIERAGGSKVYNTVVAVDAAGVVATYRKLHLYDAFGQRESDWVRPGTIASPQLVEVAGFRFGMMTCYDLRFPEVARTLADVGVDGILVPAEWVRGPLKEQQWHTLLAARAIENTAYVVAADHSPPLGVGGSVVIDPQGVVLAGIGTETDVAIGHLDRDTVDRVRRVNPALKLRRFRVVPDERESLTEPMPPA